MWIDIPEWTDSSLKYWCEVVLFLLLAYLHTIVKRQIGLCSKSSKFDRSRLREQLLFHCMMVNDEIKYSLLYKKNPFSTF